MNQQQITIDVLLEKYAKGNEQNAEDIFKRVAKGIASVEKDNHDQEYWEAIFLENMHNGAIGAGRIMSAAGAGMKAATLLNCFVQPIGDCIQGKDSDDIPGIYEALRESAETMRRGGGVGYDFSRIRPKDAKVKGTNSKASGPCSYMDVFDASCKTVESAGNRRGAQLSALKINHPDILEFIKAKRTPGRWNNFNISVFVTNEFMKAKELNKDIELFHKAEPSDELKLLGAYQRDDGNWVYKVLNACELWNTIMLSNYDYAEPGILFGDTINSDNNLHYCEYLDSTNPCGEVPLPSYGCCDLGPIILTQFVKNPFTNKAYFDRDAFVTAVKIQVRFLDNVLDATVWPLPQQQLEAFNKRRIGVGFTGLANCLAMLNLGYNSINGLNKASDIVENMRNAAYIASIELAKERGSFALFNSDEYLKEGTFASRLPNWIKDDIRQYGIRNSHLLSIAPTGTCSIAFADNASNGIEPPFSLAYIRKKRMPDNTWKEYPVIDHALRVYLSTIENNNFSDALLNAICKYQTSFEYNNNKFNVKDKLPDTIITAMELTPLEHIAMLNVVQPFIDQAISKTVNVPVECTFDDFKNIYDYAYKFKLKGVSTYRPNTVIGSVLSLGVEVKNEEPKKIISEEKIEHDKLNVFIEKRPIGTLSSKTKKVEYLSSSFEKDAFYVGVSFLKDMKRPIEVFFTVCPDGVSQEWLDSYAINLSLLARGGLNLFCKALRADRKVKSDKGRVRYGWYVKADDNKVPRFHSSEVACMAYAIQEILIEESIITELGFPIKENANIESLKEFNGEIIDESKETADNIIPGKLCNECGALAVIKKDGCSFCTNCKHIGECG